MYFQRKNELSQRHGRSSEREAAQQAELQRNTKTHKDHGKHPQARAGRRPNTCRHACAQLPQFWVVTLVHCACAMTRATCVLDQRRGAILRQIQAVHSECKEKMTSDNAGVGEKQQWFSIQSVRHLNDMKFSDFISFFFTTDTSSSRPVSSQSKVGWKRGTMSQLSQDLVAQNNRRTNQTITPTLKTTIESSDTLVRSRGID